MPGRRLPAELRFEAFVNKTGDCWIWTGYKLPNGFPRFSFQSKTVYAHHYSWFAAHGEWPNNRLSHNCNNKACVNPAHLDKSE